MIYTPKVFVSHASEDKDRFVLGFASKLRDNGIDAWIDKWEMLPGDSLVDKIFEEGIKTAQAVIVVLSKNSVNKPWVREELNASVVKRINTGSMLIPVVIDLKPNEVPEVLKSTVWETIEDIDNYDASLSRIVRAIYGVCDKPPLGRVPPYTQTVVHFLPGLTRIDSIIFKLACEQAIKQGFGLVGSEQLAEDLSALRIGADDYEESLEILDGRGYIKAGRTIGPGIPHFEITVQGFETYSCKYINGYTALQRGVGLALINSRLMDIVAIAEALNVPHMVVDHILQLYASNGLVTVTRAAGSIATYVLGVSPELGRRLKFHS